MLPDNREAYLNNHERLVIGLQLVPYKLLHREKGSSLPRSKSDALHGARNPEGRGCQHETDRWTFTNNVLDCERITRKSQRLP